MLFVEKSHEKTVYYKEEAFYRKALEKTDHNIPVTRYHVHFGYFWMESTRTIYVGLSRGVMLRN